MILCDYGCGQEAKYQFKNGRWCCSKSFDTCPATIQKRLGSNNPFYGKKHSEETKKKIRDFHEQKRIIKELNKKVKEKPLLCEYGCGQEAKYRMSNDKWCCEPKRSKCPNVRKNISKAKKGVPNPHKGVPCSEEKKKILSELATGRTASIETRKKMSESKKGKPQPWKHGGHVRTEEWKQMMRIKSTGRKLSDEAKKKISEKNKGNPSWNLGKKYSEESKKKMSNAAKKRILNGNYKKYNPISKPQKQLFTMVKEIFNQAEIEYHSLNYYIDIAIPNLKIAIEYDGSYWHQDETKDLKRQKDIESLGWKFLRYVDTIPSKQELLQDLITIHPLEAFYETGILCKQNEDRRELFRNSWTRGERECFDQFDQSDKESRPIY